MTLNTRITLVCPLCSSKKFQRLYTVNKYTKSFEIVKCVSCGLIFQDPEYWREFKDLYDERYFKGFTNFSYTRVSSIDLPIWEERVKTLEKFFNIITMFEVLEHFPNPRETLVKARLFLKDCGLLVIQTANIDSLKGKLQKGKYYYFSAPHLVYYSFTTIKRLLELSGFKIYKYWFGSELSLIRELKTLRSYYPWYYLTLKKLFNKIKIGSISINTVMVIWSVKK